MNVFEYLHPNETMIRKCHSACKRKKKTIVKHSFDIKLQMHQNLMCLDGMNTAVPANGPPSDAIKCQVLKSIKTPDQMNG